MAYRKCPGCGIITDEDELRCPSCANDHLDNEVITSEELASAIIKREISLSKIWTKSPVKIHQTLGGLP